jgi:hypothetical protein
MPFVFEENLFISIESICCPAKGGYNFMDCRKSSKDSCEELRMFTASLHS